MKKDKFGVEYTDDGETILQCPQDFIGEYTIPDGVMEIRDAAFSECEGLKGITIPEGVRRIEESAFSGCGISFVTLPASVYKIESMAFAFCPNLRHVTIKNPKIDLYLDSDEETDCFLDSPIETIVIPVGSKEHFKQFGELVNCDYKLEEMDF